MNKNAITSDTSLRSDSINYQWVIFSILTMSHLLMAMCFFSWGPLGSILKNEFQLNNSQYGMVISSMYLAIALISFPSGILVDKFGAKRMLIAATMLMGSGFAIFSIIPSYYLLFLAALLAGSGYGMINQISTKGLIYWFEVQKRGTVMGIKQTGVTVGGSLTGIYIPFLSIYMGWNIAVLLLSLSIIAMAIITLFFYKEQPDIHEESAKTKVEDGSSKFNLKELLLNPKVLIVIFLLTFLAIAQGSFTSFLVLYGEESLKLSKIFAGSLLTFAMVGATFSRIFFGIMSDRFFNGNRVIPLTLIIFISALSTFSMLFLNDTTPAWAIRAVAFFLGAGILGWNSLAIIYLAEMTSSAMAGSIIGFFLAVVCGALVVGPPAFGYIADLAGYNTAWLIVGSMLTASFTGFVIIAVKEKMQGV